MRSGWQTTGSTGSRRESYAGYRAGVFCVEKWTLAAQVNDIPTFRADHMPYGGVKGSGTGREGPRYAIEEMTELKLLVINRQGGAE